MRASVTSIASVVQFNKHNIYTEHNMATLLAEKMFTNCNSSPSRQHTVRKNYAALLWVKVGQP
jgi:hypothetical protein